MDVAPLSLFDLVNCSLQPVEQPGEHFVKIGRLALTFYGLDLVLLALSACPLGLPFEFVVAAAIVCVDEQWFLPFVLGHLLLLILCQTLEINLRAVLFECDFVTDIALIKNNLESSV